MRKLTSFVEQEPLIFRDTLVGNVRLGRKEISTQQVFHILEAVGLGDLLRQTGAQGAGENFTLSGPYIETRGLQSVRRPKEANSFGPRSLERGVYHRDRRAHRRAGFRKCRESYEPSTKAVQ